MQACSAHTQTAPCVHYTSHGTVTGIACWSHISSTPRQHSSINAWLDNSSPAGDMLGQGCIRELGQHEIKIAAVSKCTPQRPPHHTKALERLVMLVLQIGHRSRRSAQPRQIMCLHADKGRTRHSMQVGRACAYLQPGRCVWVRIEACRKRIDVGGGSRFQWLGPLFTSAREGLALTKTVRYPKSTCVT
jgi:hypothetical protein